MSVESDFFFVQLPNGQHKAMSLDELDAAYQAGAIDERTLVRPDGASEWSTLGALLYDDGVPDTSPSVTPPPYETAATPYAPNSLAPVAVWSPAALAPTVSAELPPDLDLDDLAAESALRPSKKKYVFGALGAAAAIAAIVAVGVTRTAATDAASDLAAAPKAAAAAPPPAETKLPEPKPESRLTEEQKRLLAEQDKKHEADAAKKRAERAEHASHAGSRHHRHRKSKDPFVKTGNKFDPLNGSL